MEKLVSSLPEPGNDRVGDYEETWKPDQNYGIGQHVANCLDGSSNQNFFVWFSVWSDEEPPLPERPSLPGVPEVQEIDHHMFSGCWAGSYATYGKQLQAGEKVNGSLKLTGYYPSIDCNSTCCFWVYDPHGNAVNKWCERFKEGGLYHEFSFTASLDGEYTIKVGHASNYERELHIEVSPYGWH